MILHQIKSYRTQRFSLERKISFFIRNNVLRGHPSGAPTQYREEN